MQTQYGRRSYFLFPVYSVIFKIIKMETYFILDIPKQNRNKQCATSFMIVHYYVKVSLFSSIIQSILKWKLELRCWSKLSYHRVCTNMSNMTGARYGSGSSNHSRASEISFLSGIMLPNLRFYMLYTVCLFFLFGHGVVNLFSTNELFCPFGIFHLFYSYQC